LIIDYLLLIITYTLQFVIAFVFRMTCLRKSNLESGKITELSVKKRLLGNKLLIISKLDLK